MTVDPDGKPEFAIIGLGRMGGSLAFCRRASAASLWSAAIHAGRSPSSSRLASSTCYAGLVFLAHDLLHGGIVSGRYLRHVVGWICFLPFVVSPRLWGVWHHRVQQDQRTDDRRDEAGALVVPGDRHALQHSWRGSSAAAAGGFSRTSST